MASKALPIHLRLSPARCRNDSLVEVRQRCIVLYVWTFAERWTGPHTIEVVFIFETDGHLSQRSYLITYHPFRRDELVGRLCEVGFAEVETDYDETKDGYCINATAKAE